MLPSVKVMYLRINDKMIPIFLSQTKERKECTGMGMVIFLN